MNDIAKALTPNPSPDGQRGTSSGSGPAATSGKLNVERIRADFPILKSKVAGKPLVYLDNAASSQMPQPVIDRLVRYQISEHANIHRGVHHLSEVATGAYEEARRGAYNPTYLYYTLGKLQIYKLRDDYQKAKGVSYTLKAFHDDFVKQGSIPIKAVRRILLPGDNGSTL